MFSTAWKTATVGRLGLAVLGAAVIAPAAAIALVRALDVSLGPLLAIAAGAALSLGATLFVHDLFAARVVSRLEPALRRRLAANEEDGQAQTFVALSPGDRARVYEGFLDWDIGLLTIERDRIRYRGEQTAFDVSRASVRSIDLGAVAPSWIRAPRVIVRWMGSSGEEAVALRPADCRRVSAIGPASTELASRLRAWRDQSGPAPALDASHSFGPVTARTPAEVASLRDLPVLLLWIGTLSAACGFVLGFDFWAGVEVFAAALLGVLALRWPALSSRERSMTKSDAPERERRAA